MPKKSGRPKPYDPAAAALADAYRRAEERERRRDPANWAVANDTLELPTGQDLDVHYSAQKRQVHAKRLDPFQSLHSRGGLSDGQLAAANRLFRDWCISQGIKTDDHRPVLEFRDPPPRRGPSDLVNCAMMDARERFDAALRRVGPAQAIVLRELVSPAVMCGTVVIWRAVVERITGETIPEAQAAVVRRASEDLRLVYEAIDQNCLDFTAAVARLSACT